MTQQREIKFRVWQTDAKKWAELGTLFMQDDTGALRIPGFYPGSNGRPSCQYILSQFTGLKDAEGKEIFEGDIIFNHHLRPDGSQMGNNWIVRFGEHKTSGDYYASTAYGWYFEDPRGGINSEQSTAQTDGAWKVVGNIFEGIDETKSSKKDSI